MKINLQTHLIIYYLIFSAFFFVSKKTAAQVPSLAITPSVQCLNANGTTTAVAIVSSSVPGATSYSWAPITSTACPVTILSSAPNGSMITLSYSCCGTHSFICYAYNGPNYLTSLIITSTVNCTPSVSIAGSTAICSGSPSTLTATGAQSYTWNVGVSGHSIAITPTNSTFYVATGSFPNGCTDVDTAFITVSSPPVPVFSAVLLPNGVVSFSNISTNTLSSVSYTWNFGNSTTSTLSSPTTIFSNNGSYTITLTANNNSVGCGAVTSTQVIQVASSSGTPCAANYTCNINPNGNVAFSSTSTGTNSSTNFLWNFGDGTSSNGVGSAGMFANHNYAPGTYIVTLYISSLPACSSSITTVVSIPASANCTLNADFIFAANQNNSVNFLSTSTGTVAGSTYSWNYGDNSSGNGQSSTHVYTNSGTYTVTLLVSNGSNPPCVDAHIAVVTICNLVADYTHTVTANGLVYFNSSLSTTYPNTIYEWDFGDGVYSNAMHPGHTYNNAGSYTVALYLNRHTSCADSITQSINITGINCSANSTFTLGPTNTPSSWTATPTYPWNITSALWTWGDGTKDTLLYSSHIYSLSGTYSICLSVTVSCGASSTYCFPFIASESPGNSSGIYFVNITPPAMSTGITELNSGEVNFVISPNPNAGEFNIFFNSSETKPTAIFVYDLSGKIIYSSSDIEASTNIKNVNLGEVSNGIYFMKIISENKSHTAKLLINR